MSTLSERQDLRSALTPWIILSFVLATLLYLIAWLAMDSEKPVFQLFLALASALVSVGVALLITEWVLKPFYVRDVLAIARLSSDIYNTGLDSITGYSGTNLAPIFGMDDKVTVAGSADMLRLIWPQILTSASKEAKSVSIFLEGGEQKVADELTAIWKKRVLQKGSTVAVYPGEEGLPQLVIAVGRTLIVGLSDGASGNPLLLQFRGTSEDPFHTTIRQRITADSEKDTVPLSASRERVKNGTHPNQN